MALAYLAWIVIVMGVISGVGAVLLLVVKNDKANRAILYLMAVWGAALAILNIISLPINWIAWRSVAAVCGLIGLAGGIIRFTSKGNRIAATAAALASVFSGMIIMFVI